MGMGDLEDVADVADEDIVVRERIQCSFEICFARTVEQGVDFGVVMVCG